MKILILTNFFNYYNRIPNYKDRKFFVRFYDNFFQYKLKKLVKKLKHRYENVEIKIINSVNKELRNIRHVENEFIFDYIQKIDHLEYLKILKNIKEQTRLNLIEFYNSLKSLKKFYIRRFFLGNLIELEFFNFFNLIFGDFEVLKKILEIESYDKAIIFNYNPNYSNFISFLQSNFKNVSPYQDSFLKKINKRLHWYKYIFLFLIFKATLKKSLTKKRHIIINKNNNIRKNIVFFGYKKGKLKLSPFKSTFPIYKELIKHKELNPIYFHNVIDYIPLKKLNQNIKILYQLKKIWFNHQKDISSKIQYDSIKLNKQLNDFYSFIISYEVFQSLNNLFYFEEYLRYYPPSLIITTASKGASTRLFLKYCSVKKIPTMCIPLAGTLVLDEEITSSDLSIITTSGENDRNYYIRKGEITPEKAFVTGRPRYETFYKEKIKKLNEVKDMFNNRIYKFEPNKFTILLATNSRNDKPNEIIIVNVIEALKELNLIENLIIKMHPAETGNVQKKIFQDSKIKPIIIQHYDIFEVINSCDLVLSTRSTAVLETMIVGKPVILLDLYNETMDQFYKLLFIEESPIIKAFRKDDIVNALKKLIFDRNYYLEYSNLTREFAKLYSYYDKNEKPMEKTLNLIFKIINYNPNFKNSDLNEKK